MKCTPGLHFGEHPTEKENDPYSYTGHLVMFPSGYGYYDLYRRNSIYKDAEGKAKKAGKQHDWNRMEILAIGSRIRHAITAKRLRTGRSQTRTLPTRSHRLATSLQQSGPRSPIPRLDPHGESC